MWTKASQYHKLPSEIIDPDHKLDSLTRYLADNAVTFFGITIENALQERVNNGSEKEPHWEKKYALAQVLEDDFRLPRPVSEAQKRKQVGASVKAMTNSMKPQATGGKAKSMIPESLARQLRARGILQ